MQPAARRDVDAARAPLLLTRYVSGRGAVPAVRIGAQPYGILADDRVLAASAARRRRGRAASWTRLHGAARRRATPTGRRWRPSVPASVHGAATPHQTLLDVLGLHPASVEFHQRYAESLDDLFNHLNLAGLGERVLHPFNGRRARRHGAASCCSALGATRARRPTILELFFFSAAAARCRARSSTTGRSRRPSRSGRTRPTAATTSRWLADAAGASLDDACACRTASPTTPPDRAALPAAAPRAAARLLRHGRAAAPRRRRARRTSGSRRASASPRSSTSPSRRRRARAAARRSTAADAAITGDDDLLGRRPHHRRCSTAHDATRCSREQVAALDLLRDVPTARLERLLAEHVDCCTYRLDAWLGGPRARAPRRRCASSGAMRTGVHLGAYGWLEDVRPKQRAAMPPVELDGRPAPRSSAATAQPPLVRDPANGGYVHAPSLNQAVTAAVLRSGYLANATPDDARRARGQPVLAARAPRPRPARGHPQRPEPGRAARLPARARPARPPRAGRGRPFVFALRKAFPLAPTASSDDARRRTCRSRRSRPERRRRARARRARQATGSRPTRSARHAARGDAGAGRRDRRGGRPRCSTSTTRSPISRWRRASTRRCRATSTAPQRASTARAAAFRPSPRSRTPTTGSSTADTAMRLRRFGYTPGSTPGTGTYTLETNTTVSPRSSPRPSTATRRASCG